MDLIIGDSPDVQKDDIVRIISRVVDPGIGVSLVDLGLVEEIEVDGDRIRVAVIPPGKCPFLPYMLERIYRDLMDTPGVSRVEIDLLWDRRWSPERMTPSGREALDRM